MRRDDMPQRAPKTVDLRDNRIHDCAESPVSYQGKKPVMTCPFPGMDPYLELQLFWGDFTPRFITVLANNLLPKLLPRYDVRVEEYLYVAHEEIRLHRVRPDVTITRQTPWQAVPVPGVALLDAATEELEYPDFEPRAQ